MIDRLLARDSEIDMRIERDMCFFRRLQHRDTATSFFNTHTHSLTPTLTHTPHMTGQQWLAGQVVPEEFFFRVLQIFLTTSGQQEFFDRQGVTQHPKIFPECYKCFLLFMFVYVRRHYAAKI